MIKIMLATVLICVSCKKVENNYYMINVDSTENKSDTIKNDTISFGDAYKYLHEIDSLIENNPKIDW